MALHKYTPNETNTIGRYSLGLYQRWFYVNKLSLNVQKTHIVVSTPKNTNNKITSTTLGNQQILRVNNARFLGINIDNGLEWDEHINHIVKMLSSGSYAIHTVKKYLSLDNLK